MEPVKNTSEDAVDVLFDGRNVHFEPGEVKFLEENLARHIVLEDREAFRLKLVSELPKEEPVAEEKESEVVAEEPVAKPKRKKNK